MVPNVNNISANMLIVIFLLFIIFLIFSDSTFHKMAQPAKKQVVSNHLILIIGKCSVRIRNQNKNKDCINN